MTRLTAMVLAVGLATAVAAGGEPPAGTLDGTLVVLNKAEATASLLALPEGTQIARLPTGQGPHEVAISPDGRTAVVADYGVSEPGHTLTVIDLPGRRVRATIDLRQYHRPHGIQFIDGARVAVTAEQEQHVLVVNVEAGAVEKAIETGQRVSHMLVLSPDRRRAYVASIGSGTASVIDLESSELIATIETGRGAEGIDIAPDGGEVWVSNRAADTVSVVDTRTLQVAETLQCASFPIRVKFAPDGKHVLVSNARTGDVAVFDAASRRQVHRVSMQEQAVQDTGDRLFEDRFGRGPVPVGILFGPKGRLAFVANTNADVVTVLDASSWSVAGRLTAGREPDGLGYAPPGRGRTEGRRD